MTTPESNSDRIKNEKDFFADWRLNAHGDRLRWERELRGLIKSNGNHNLGRVLSIGCGRGQFESMLSPYAAEILGIDLSPETILDAREYVSKSGIKNIRFECADISTFDFDMEFDTIICVGMLHHLNDDECIDLLARVHRHMSPGGFVHTQDPNVNGLLRFAGRLILGKKYDNYHTADERELDPVATREIFLQSGFDHVEIDYMDLSLIPGMQLFPDAPEWVMSVFNQIDRVWCASPLARWSSGFTINARR